MNVWGWTFLAVMLALVITFMLYELRYMARTERKLQELMAATDELIANDAGARAYMDATPEQRAAWARQTQQENAEYGELDDET